jgi:hypothetical protein
MDTSDIEQWKSTTKSMVSVRLIERLDWQAPEVVWHPGQVSEISTRNRQLIQARVQSPKDDPFTNGLLALVTGPDEVVEELGQNPNALTEEDMRGLFRLNDRTIKARLAKIDGLGTLSALLSNGEELGARASSLRLVEERLAELSPEAELVATPEDPLFGDTTGIGAPVRLSA